MLAKVLFFCAACASSALLITPAAPHSAAQQPLAGVRTPPPAMGLFDQLKKAFDNVDYSKSPAKYEQTNARASHILVKDEADAVEIKSQIAAGNMAFDEAAMKYSTCNSSRQGGKLGKFVPGQMVSEFDDVVFGVKDTGIDFVPKYELNEVHGPIATQFGYHLIMIETRNMADFDFRAKEGKL